MMKTTFSVIVMLFATPAVPEEQQHPCKTLGELAYKIMALRQTGVPMSDIMQISDNELVKAVILDAYSQPRFSTHSYKQKSVDDFRNTVEVECYKDFDN